jgi:hypothetical protein
MSRNSSDRLLQRCQARSSSLAPIVSPIPRAFAAAPAITSTLAVGSRVIVQARVSNHGMRHRVVLETFPLDRLTDRPTYATVDITSAFRSCTGV